MINVAMPTALRVFLVICLVTLSGCGQDTYDSRLAVTSEYFEHVNSLNANLSASAVSLGAIVVRPPLQFSEVRDDEETEGIDETQPNYLDRMDGIPGLLATYGADVFVEVDGQDEPRPAFIYIASNEPLINGTAQGDPAEASGEELDPLEFHTEIENRLSASFGVYLEPGKFGDGSEPNMRFSEDLPRKAPEGELQYEKSKRYEAVRFVPDEPLPGFDVAMQYNLYKLAGPGDLQAILLFVIPEQARPDENLPTRIRMMLETLVNRKMAGAGSPLGGGAGGDGGGGLNF